MGLCGVDSWHSLAWYNGCKGEPHGTTRGAPAYRAIEATVSQNVVVAMFSFARRQREPLATTLLVAGAFTFFTVVLSHQRFADWLFFRHFALALIAVAWGMCCTGLGFWLVERVLPAIALGTKFTLAFPLGVVLFGTAVAVAGFTGGLGTTFYLALLAVGLASSFQPMVRLVRVLSRLRLRVNSAPSKTTNALLVAAATLALALVYVPTLTPRHLSYDTLWYHLTVAEHYVAAGGIERLDEGWFLGLYPQLASWLYTWALLTPLLGVVDRSLLCMQMEFVIFLGTLATIPSLARAILKGVGTTPRPQQRWSWVVIFVFPSVFLYDLVAAADHVSALFAAPAVLILLRAWNSPTAGCSLLLAAFLSGGTLTKYSAAILFAPVGLMWLVRCCVGMVRARNTVGAAAWRSSALWFLGTGIVLTSSHWVKNWLWYGSPFYPTLNAAFTPTPWHDHASAVYHGWITGAITAPKSGLVGYLQTTAKVFGFSFMSHDFHWLTKGRPMAGSLFTLTMIPLAIVSASRRVIGVALLVHACVLCWALSHAQDRFLQTILPIMVAMTAAALHVLWQKGRAVRFILVALVAGQTVWGLDVLAWPYRHNWYVDLANRGAASLEGKALPDEVYFSPWTDIGRKLPSGANSKLLIHDVQLHYGTGARVVNDWSPTQGALDYGAVGTPSAVRDALTNLGVTHVAWYPAHSSGNDSLAGDILFHLFARDFLAAEDVAGIKFAALEPTRAAPAPNLEPLLALYLGCGGNNKDGVFEVSQLHVHPQAIGSGYPVPRREFVAPKQGKLAVPPDVSILIAESKCAATTPKPAGWTLLVQNPSLKVWARPSTGT